ncbi:MAG: hypothetical protein V1722_01645 [Candidatus Micrarchaeota archaeon]
MQQTEVLHYPRLDTILLVEETIRKSKTELTPTALYLSLQGRIMYQTLKVILEYLKKSNKITFAKNKIVWIFTNAKLDKATTYGKKY